MALPAKRHRRAHHLFLRGDAGGPGTAQSAAAAQEPAFLFLGGILLLIPFSVGTALFLALLWITTRSHRSAPLPRAEGRAPVWVWAPVFVALLCAACLYALSGVQMAGGGL